LGAGERKRCANVGMVGSRRSARLKEAHKSNTHRACGHELDLPGRGNRQQEELSLAA
jgi:hypothetical protein